MANDSVALALTLRQQEGARNRSQQKRARQAAALDATEAELKMWDEAIERTRAALAKAQGQK